jgi:hypothetical protein
VARNVRTGGVHTDKQHLGGGLSLDATLHNAGLSVAEQVVSHFRYSRGQLYLHLQVKPETLGELPHVLAGHAHIMRMV